MDKPNATSSTLSGNYSILFNPDINQTKQCTIYRSIFHAALPISTGINEAGDHISKYRNAEDRKDEQELDYTDWAQKLWTEITVNNNGDYKDGNLKILALSYVVFVEYFIGLLSEAMFYVIFSIVAVLFYMTIHLRSFILSFGALIQILMSFPLAYFFYRLLFQVTHFVTFSSLIIFVLLGVGADDVFVFTDAWYQSINFIDLTGDNIILQRMSFAYRRASIMVLFLIIKRVKTFRFDYEQQLGLSFLIAFGIAITVSIAYFAFIYTGTVDKYVIKSLGLDTQNNSDLPQTEMTIRDSAEALKAGETIDQKDEENPAWIQSSSSSNFKFNFV